MSRATSLLPGDAKTYANDMVPPPMKEDLRRVGLWVDENTIDRQGALPGSKGKAEPKIPITVQVSAIHARLMGHLIERRVMPGVHSRSDFARLAIHKMIEHLADEIQTGSFTTDWMRVESERQVYASRLAEFYGDEHALLLRKSVKLAEVSGDLAGAKRTLRSARRFMAQLPAPAAERFVKKMLGGDEESFGGEVDEVAAIWGEVMAEEPDEKEETL